jgi:urease accessory protein
LNSYAIFSLLIFLHSYRIEITLSNKALAHITTQGATRVYKMQNNFGTQMINIAQEEGTYLEYIPDQIIPV